MVKIVVLFLAVITLVSCSQSGYSPHYIISEASEEESSEQK